jgi:hypothetical protein
MDNDSEGAGVLWLSNIASVGGRGVTATRMAEYHLLDNNAPPNRIVVQDV